MKEWKRRPLTPPEATEEGITHRFAEVDPPSRDGFAQLDACEQDVRNLWERLGVGERDHVALSWQDRDRRVEEAARRLHVSVSAARGAWRAAGQATRMIDLAGLAMGRNDWLDMLRYAFLAGQECGNFWLELYSPAAASRWRAADRARKGKRRSGEDWLAQYEAALQKIRKSGTTGRNKVAQLARDAIRPLYEEKRGHNVEDGSFKDMLSHWRRQRRLSDRSPEK